MKEKLVKSDITAILKAAGIERDKAASLTGQIIETLARALAVGKTIELRGLGTFEQRQRKARTRFNPRNRDPVYIPAGRGIIFKPGKNLKNKLKEEMPMR